MTGNALSGRPGTGSLGAGRSGTAGNPRAPLWGALFVAAASILWGTTGTAATFAAGVGPLAIGAVAMGIGGLLQALTAARAIRQQWHGILRQWQLAVLGAVAVAVYPLAFYSSMDLSGVAVGTVVSIGSAPVAAALIERFADRKPLTRRWTAGALLGVGGAAVLSFAGHSPETPAGTVAAGSWSFTAGILLGLLAGGTYALYSWAVHRMIGGTVVNAGSGTIAGGVTSRAAMGCVFGLGGLLLMPVLAATGAPLLASGTNFAVGAYMALVPMFAGYVLFGLGLARVRASTATGISLLETVVAAALAMLVVGERLPALGWLGAAVVLGSMFILAPGPAGRRGRSVASPDVSTASAGGASAVPAAAHEGPVQQQAGAERQQQDTDHDGGRLLAADARRDDRECEQAHQ